MTLSTWKGKQNHSWGATAPSRLCLPLESYLPLDKLPERMKSLKQELVVKNYLNAGEIARLEGIGKATVTRYIKGGMFGNVRKVAQEWRVPLPSYEKWRESTKLKNHRKETVSG